MRQFFSPALMCTDSTNSHFSSSRLANPKYLSKLKRYPITCKTAMYIDAWLTFVQRKKRRSGQISKNADTSPTRKWAEETECENHKFWQPWGFKDTANATSICGLLHVVFYPSSYTFISLLIQGQSNVLLGGDVDTDLPPQEKLMTLEPSFRPPFVEDNIAKASVGFGCFCWEKPEKELKTE